MTTSAKQVQWCGPFPPAVSDFDWLLGPTLKVFIFRLAEDEMNEQ